MCRFHFLLLCYVGVPPDCVIAVISYHSTVHISLMTYVSHCLPDDSACTYHEDFKDGFKTKQILPSSYHTPVLFQPLSGSHVHHQNMQLHTHINSTSNIFLESLYILTGNISVFHNNAEKNQHNLLSLLQYSWPQCWFL